MNELFFAGEMLAIYDNYKNQLNARENFSASEVRHCVKLLYALEEAKMLPPYIKKMMYLVKYSYSEVRIRDLYELENQNSYDIERVKKIYHQHCDRLFAIGSLNQHRKLFGMDVESFCRAIDNDEKGWIAVSRSLCIKTKISSVLVKAALFADSATDPDVYFGLIREKKKELGYDSI